MQVGSPICETSVHKTRMVTTALLPEIGGHGKRSFLQCWWLLLYLLSMLARYEPAAWMTALEVNRSPIAVPLERVCELTLERVPPLICRALGLTAFS